MNTEQSPSVAYLAESSCCTQVQQEGSKSSVLPLNDAGKCVSKVDWDTSVSSPATSRRGPRGRPGVKGASGGTRALTCRRCERELPETAFAVRRDRPSGRQYYCRECQRGYHRDYMKRSGASVVAQQREYRLANPKKVAGRLAVASALASGGLAKLPCEVCGSEHAEAHHDDYRKPLDVRWLCRAHHRQHHDEHGPGRVA